MLPFSPTARPDPGSGTTRARAPAGTTSLVINNLVAAAGYVMCVFATDWFGVFGAMFIVMIADRMYWAAWPNFVKRLTGTAEMDSWFALTEAIKNGCFGVGALIGAAALAIDPKAGATTLIILNAASSVVAAWLFMTIKGTEEPVPAEVRAGTRLPGPESPTVRPARGPTARTWLHVLRQSWMVPLVLAQSALSFAWLLPVSILPVYAVEVLHLGAWLPSTLSALNCAGVFFLQPLVTARLRPVRRTRAVMTSGLLAALAVVVLAVAPKASDGAALHCSATPSAPASTGCWTVVAVATNRVCPALDVARKAGIGHVAAYPVQEYASRPERDARMAADLKRAGADFVLVGGYSEGLEEDFLRHFPDRAISVYPTILPAFGDLDEAIGPALDYSVKTLGLTVRFRDPLSLSEGPIIAQIPIPVDVDDTAESVTPKIAAVERDQLPRIMQAFAEDRITREGRLVHVRTS